MKKRVAIWIHGGIGTGHFSQGVPMLQNIIVGMSDCFEVVVYTQARANDDFNHAGFEIRSPGLRVRASWLRWFVLIFYFLRDHNKKRFHIVMAFWGYPAGTVAVFLSKLLRLPSVVYVQGGDAAGIARINYGVFQRSIPRAIVRWTYERTSLLIAMSNYQRDQLRRFHIRKKIQVIPWGVDLQQFPFRPRQRNGILNVIHVGHFAPVKDQATVLRTFVEISKKHPARLRLFGADGGSRPSLQNLSAELGITHLVEFNDVVPYRDMPQLYQWADVMLHTSLSEGQCMALTEAAASGVLMAGTNIAPLYDLGEGCGLIVKPGDFHALSAGVLQILSDETRWSEKIRKARRWSEAHPLSWTINQISNELSAL